MTKLAINSVQKHSILLKATVHATEFILLLPHLNLYEPPCFQKQRTRARKLGILIVDESKDQRQMSDETLNQSTTNIQVSSCKICLEKWKRKKKKFSSFGREKTILRRMRSLWSCK